MFVLSILKVGSHPPGSFSPKLTHLHQDTVAVHPTNFGAPVDQALVAELNKKYANRVLHDVGLCVCVFDLSQAGEGKVRYGDGFLWYKGAKGIKRL
jgi:DNA-directed RNA polymerase subunit E'/Rpb7